MAGITINPRTGLQEVNTGESNLPSDRLARELGEVPPVASLPPRPSSPAGYTDSQGNWVSALPEDIPQREVPSEASGWVPPKILERGEDQSAFDNTPQDTYQEPQNVIDPSLETMPDPSSYVGLTGEELLNQQKQLNYSNIDWKTREDLKTQHPDSYKELGAGSILEDRQALINSATKFNVNFNNKAGIPTDMTALSYIQAATKLEDANQAANLVTAVSAAFSHVMPTVEEDLVIPADQDDFMALAGLPSNKFSTKLTHEIEKEFGEDDAAAHIGKLISERLRVANAGNPNVGSTESEVDNPDYKALGHLVLKMMEDSGRIMSINKDGRDIIRLTPKGNESKWASNWLVNDLVDSSRSYSSIVPATGSGELVGPRSKVSHKDKLKPSPKKATGIPDEAKEWKRILGSMGKQLPIAKTVIIASLAKLAVAEVKQGKASLDQAEYTGAARLFNLDGKKAVEDASATPEDRRQTKLAFNDLNRSLAYIGKNFNEGNLRYSTYFLDNSVWRAYDSTVDANMQGNLVMRAAYSGVSTPMMVSQGNFTPVSLREITALYDSLRDNKNYSKKLKGRQAEIGFIVSLAQAMEEDTADKTVHSLATSVTSEKMASWANTGKNLLAAARLITDGGKQQIVAHVSNTENGNINLEQLPPTVKAALDTILNDSTTDKKNFGFRIQAYIDAYNYMQAKQAGTAFTSNLTLAIDQNSAGRTMQANDVGNRQVLERVGLLWDYQDNLLGSSQPLGSPRGLFTTVIGDTAVDKVFTSSDPAMRRQLRELFLSRNEDKAFNEDLGKKVLMTTDYGMAMQYHTGSAIKFIEKNPDFAKQLTAITGLSGNKLALKINSLFGATLAHITNTDQAGYPKKMNRALQMFGKGLVFPGMMGEDVPLGANIREGTGEYTTIKYHNGDSKRIEKTKSVFSSRGKSKEKNVIAYDEEGEESHIVHTPGPGTAAVNGIGPLLGQYRESMTTNRTIAAINGPVIDSKTGKERPRKASEMTFAQPVFDNIICNADNYLQMHFYANQIATLETLEWDIQKPIQQNFEKQLREGRDELAQIKGPIIVDNNSKYIGIYDTLDSVYVFLDLEMKAAAEEGGKPRFSEKKKEFIQTLKENGYTYLADRDSNMSFSKEHTSQELLNLAKAYLKYSEMAKGFNEWYEKGLKQKALRMPAIKEGAKNNALNFFN